MQAELTCCAGTRLDPRVVKSVNSPPLRLAADREGAVEVDEDGVRREIARMAFRLQGVAGSGGYEVLVPS